MPLDYATGKVDRVMTNDDGTTDVNIQDADTNETFHHPSEMTDAQLAELKRAQDNGRTVSVFWEMVNGKRKVKQVWVFGAGHDRPAGKRAAAKKKKRRR